MSELKPFADIDFGGEVVKATRENTLLYQHIGAAAIYDHIFVIHPTNKSGGYIWANQPPKNPMFEAMEPLVVKHDCELHVNIQTPAPNDIEAFNRAVSAAIEEFDGVPEGWE